MLSYVAMAGPALSVLLPHLPCARDEHTSVILSGPLLNVSEGLKRGILISLHCASWNANKDVSLFMVGVRQTQPAKGTC